MMSDKRYFSRSIHQTSSVREGRERRVPVNAQSRDTLTNPVAGNQC